MQNFLSQTEQEHLKAQHKKERDKRICDRIKAVLLHDKGWTHETIAEALLLSDEAVRQHIKEYQADQKLKPENGGSCSKLNAQQAELLLKHLREHTYLYAKDIVAYVNSVFAVKYTVAGMTALQKIELAYPQAPRVHLFCDNAKYYKNKEVMAYLTTSKIKMHFLPTYSPNLNPIERLWKFMNEEVLYNRYYESFSGFRDAVMGFLECLAAPPIELTERLSKRITDSFRVVGKVLTTEQAIATI